MARLVPYRAKRPESLRPVFEQAMRARIYVVAENGPTSFVLQEDESRKKFKVFIGERHSCSCREKSDLCVHVLFVLHRIYRIPAENPVTWQLSLIDSEITSILQGRYRQIELRKAQARTLKVNNELVPRKCFAEDECTICYDHMHLNQFLVWCQKGCGNNFHRKCFKTWVENCSDNVTCPLCRVHWDRHDMEQLKKRQNDTHHHVGISCNSCMITPIKGTRYRCCTCANYNLCDPCFKGRHIHIQHSFVYQIAPIQEWIPAERVILTEDNMSASHQFETLTGIRSTRIPRERQNDENGNSILSLQRTETSTFQPVEVNSHISHLMYRDITADDYDLLLQLDENNAHFKGVPTFLIDAIPTNIVDINCQFDDCCPICLEEIVIGEEFKKLPNCSHVFHKVCINLWLMRSNCCAVCNQQVFLNIDELRGQEVTILNGSFLDQQSQDNIERSSQHHDYYSDLSERNLSSGFRPYQNIFTIPSSERLTTTQSNILNYGNTSSLHFQISNEQREKRLQIIRTKLQLRKTRRLTETKHFSDNVGMPLVQPMELHGYGIINAIGQSASGLSEESSSSFNHRNSTQQPEGRLITGPIASNKGAASVSDICGMKIQTICLNPKAISIRKDTKSQKLMQEENYQQSPMIVSVEALNKNIGTLEIGYGPGISRSGPMKGKKIKGIVSRKTRSHADPSADLEFSELELGINSCAKPQITQTGRLIKGRAICETVLPEDNRLLPDDVLNNIPQGNFDVLKLHTPSSTLRNNPSQTGKLIKQSTTRKLQRQQDTIFLS